MVVAYHAGLPVHGGYIGVDVFFVLSGYLISGLIVGEIEQTGRLSLLAFYARRARRLLPEAGVVLVATLLIGMAVLSPFELHDLAHSARFVAVYLGNVHFAETAVNYQSVGQLDPLLHTWSLAVEEQFYVAWPLLISALVWFGARRNLRSMAVGVGVGAVTAASLVLCIVLTGSRQPWAFFLSPPRAWEFGAGALVAVVPVGFARRRMIRWLGVVGFGGVGAAAFLFDDRTLFPGTSALLPVLGTALVLLAIAGHRDHPWWALLRHRVAQWIGRHSYGWYLWHWPLVVFARSLWPDASVATLVAVSLAALAAAAVTFRLVEHPVRHSRWLVARPGVSLALAALLVVGTVGVGFGADARASALAREPYYRPLVAERNAGFYHGCIVQALEVRPRHDCVFGQRRASETVVLFGDSHAAMWIEAFDRIGAERGWRVVVAAKAECAPATLRRDHSVLRRPYVECDEWRARVLRDIVATAPLMVVMASWDQLYFPELTAAQRSAWATALRTTSTRLDAAAINHVVLLDPPLPPYNVMRCLSRAHRPFAPRQNCDFPRRVSPLQSVTRAVMERSVHGRVLALNDVICPGPVCPARSEGRVVYLDDNHLAQRYVATLAPELERRLFP